MSINVRKLNAIIHLSHHERHQNDILKTGSNVRVSVCLGTYLFYLFIFFGDTLLSIC
jgi:hypothetical protein